MSGFQKARAITLSCGGADIPQGRFVKTSAAGIILATAGDDAVGVSLETYDDSAFDEGNAEKVIPVAVLDGAVLQMEAGDAITAGAAIGSDATGRAVAVTGVTDKVLGYAVEAAAGAGSFVSVVASKGGFAAQS